MFVCMWKTEINHSPAVYTEWAGWSLGFAKSTRMTGQQVPWTHLSPFSTKTTGICFHAQPFYGFNRFESGSLTWVKGTLSDPAYNTFQPYICATVPSSGSQTQAFVHGSQAFHQLSYIPRLGSFSWCLISRCSP